MEKIKIIYKKTKKSFEVKAKLENDKEMTLDKNKITYENIEELNDQECEAERIKGQFVSIKFNGQEILKTGAPEKNTQIKPSNSSEKFNNLHRGSKAPYNFITLNDLVVERDPLTKDISFDKYHNHLLTGNISICIETKTDIFIRDTYNCDQIPSDFFSPSNKIRIPGSSLRGLIRNMVEITSYSAMSYSAVKSAQDIHYFYRKFTDYDKDLEKNYRDRTLKGDKEKGFYNEIEAGYIKKTGYKEYKIFKAQNLKGTTFYRVEEDLVIEKGLNNRMSVLKDKSYVQSEEYQVYDIKKILFVPQPVQMYQHSQKLRYAKVTNIRKYDIDKSKDEQEGYLVFSNWMRGPKKRNNGKGKHMHWIIGPKSNESIVIDQILYQNTKNNYECYSEKKIYNYFEKIEKNEEIPCFYSLIDGKVYAFGFTGNFRIPFEQSLNNQFKQDVNKIDIAQSIFGIEDKFSTRIFFEDAFLHKEHYDKVYKQDFYPKILASPKPTCYQHYLEQGKISYSKNREDTVNGVNGLKSYNVKGEIRGFKQYWHRTDEWKQTDKSEIKKHQSQYALKIKPVMPGAIFQGKIRFENLSEIELGALLFSLNLKQNLCHKIGLGKPLGLGSIKISTKLLLSDRVKRYSDLMYEWGFQSFKKEDEKVNEFIEKFERYIINAIKENKSSLWDVERLSELEKMLNFENTKIPEWNQKTQYSTLKESDFKERQILPNPSEVIGINR